MHKDILLLLAQMGFKERESRIYLTCLKYKDGLFIHQIVKETKIQRSTTVLVIQRLIQRGFIQRSKAGRRFKFFALAPEAILFRQRQWTEDFEKILPLLAQADQPPQDMEILHFEGMDGFKQTQQDILLRLQTAKGEKRVLLGFYGSAEYLKIFPEAQRAFIRKRVQMGIWGRAIATQKAADRPEWSNDPKMLREFKFVADKDFPFQMIVEIYADSVMLYSPIKPIGGIIIRNSRIAQSMRALFKLLWSLLPM